MKSRPSFLSAGKRCKKYEELLSGKLFGDLNAQEERLLDDHLVSCPACQAQWHELREVLAVAGKPVQPELPPHFWEGYWNRLRDRMAREPEVPLSLWQRLQQAYQPRWRPALQLATAVALVAFGIIIGRNFWQKDAAPVASEQPAEQIIPVAHELDARSEQLLERSKILLIGILNDDFAGASTADLTRQRQVSRELISEVRALRTSSSASANLRLMQLMEQLELVLLQIANLEIENDLTGVELVREGIDRDGLLLKINLEELAKQARANRAGASTHGQAL